MANNQPVLIAVLGVTGAGKSTFINNACGSSLTVGHGIFPCTQQITVTYTQVDGVRVGLIDTPGFDDTFRSDADILEAVATWLHEQYQRNILLSGIILLANIDGNRAYRSELTRTRLFKQICGEEAYQNIIIGTTMWSKLANRADGDRQVQERMQSQDFWLSLVANGTRVIPHDNNRQSAHRIIRLLLKNIPLPLKMQKQLRNSNGWVNGTDAGRQLISDLGAVSAQEVGKLDEIVTQQRWLNGSERVNAEKKIRDLEAKIEGLQQQLWQLNNTRVRASSSAPDWINALVGVGGLATSAVATVGIPLIAASAAGCVAM